MSPDGDQRSLGGRANLLGSAKYEKETTMRGHPKVSGGSEARAISVPAGARQRQERQPYATEVEDYAAEKTNGPSGADKRSEPKRPVNRR